MCGLVVVVVVVVCVCVGADGHNVSSLQDR